MGDNQVRLLFLQIQVGHELQLYMCAKHAVCAYNWREGFCSLDPSLEMNLAQKCLAGMPPFKSCKFPFQIFNMIGQALL